MAPSLVFFLFIYAFIGTWLTTAVFGKRLMQLQFSQLQKEGDLRFDLVRARENSGALLCHVLHQSHHLQYKRVIMSFTAKNHGSPSALPLSAASGTAYSAAGLTSRL